jgi:hypothetical protein
MTRKPSLFVRAVPPEIKSAIAKIATAESRSESNAVRVLIREALRRRGLREGE